MKTLKHKKNDHKTIFIPLQSHRTGFVSSMGSTIWSKSPVRIGTEDKHRGKRRDINRCAETNRSSKRLCVLL